MRSTFEFVGCWCPDRYDVDKLKKIADVGIKTRDFLDASQKGKQSKGMRCPLSMLHRELANEVRGCGDYEH